MSKTRTGKKFLSLLLTLCMVLSLTPALGITASAAEGDSWVGTESFDYSASATGTGWTWDAATKTLTLSGVDASKEGDHGINIQGDAKIILEGANKATSATKNKNALSCGGGSYNLTIEGSGTLDVSSTNEAMKGAIHGLDLTINSGYITASSDKMAIRASREMTFNGGYITASSSGTMNTVYAATYTQNGGYLKSSGGAAALSSTSATISGGYLELSGNNIGFSRGTSGGTFTNSGGVVKANGGTRYGISADSASFTGGVTIVSGTTAAISATVSYDNDEAIKVGTDITDAGTNVVIAKSAYSTNQTSLTALDGTYIKSAGASALTPSAAVTVSGGSYLESTGSSNYAYYNTSAATTVSKTLVCIGGDQSAKFNGLTVATGATLYSSANIGGVSGYGSNPFTISGNLIGDGNTGISGVNSLTVDGGYVCGIGKTNYGVNVSSQTAGLTVTGGYCTFKGNTNGIKSLGTVSFTGGAVTAVGACNFSSEPSLPANRIVFGSTANPGALTAATYGTNNYQISGAGCKVVFFTKDPPPPVFADGFGDTGCAFDTYIMGGTNDRGYTFAGWFDGTTPLTSAESAVSGTTYTAKWTVSGKTVITTPLDFTGSVTLPEGCGITWNSPTLTLDGATIDCSNVTDCAYAINLPDNATIVLADGSTNSVTSGSTTYSNNVEDSSAIMYPDQGNLSIIGNGSLHVRTIDNNENDANFTQTKCCGFSWGVVTIGGGSYKPVVSVHGGIAGNQCFGANAAVKVLSGDFTASIGPISTKVFTPFQYAAVWGHLTTTGTVMKGDTAPGVLDNTNYSSGAYHGNGVRYLNVSYTPYLSFDNGGGSATAKVEIKSDMALPADPTWVSGDTAYTFDGWYPNADGTGVKLTLEIAQSLTGSTTYYAKWTNGGKTVRTAPLDCTTMAVNTDNLLTEGWAWYATATAPYAANTLVLDGATIDCSAVTDCYYAVNLPAGATVQLADDTENVIKSGKGEDGETLTPISYCIYSESGNLSILGNGSLDVTASNDIDVGSAVELDTLTIGSATDSPTVTFTGYSYGIHCESTLTIDGGSVTANSTATDGNGVRGDVTVNGGSLTASGDDTGIGGDVNVTGGTATASSERIAIDGYLTTEGTVIAGDDVDSATNDTTDYSEGQDAETSAKYVYISFGPSATVTNVEITGTQNTELASNATVTITLANDTFASSLSGNWITNLPANLTQSVARTDDTTATITISGTPMAASGASMAITIPAGALATATTESVTVSANANAKFVIAPAAPAEVAATDISVTATSVSIAAAKSVTTNEFTVTLASADTLTGNEAWTAGTGSALNLTQSYAGSTGSALTAATQYKVWTRVKAVENGAPASAAVATAVYTAAATPASAVATTDITVTGTSASVAANKSLTMNEYAVTLSGETNAPASGWVTGTGASGTAITLNTTDLASATSHKVWMRVKEADGVPASAAVASAAFYTAYATPTSAAYSISASTRVLTITDPDNYEVNTKEDFTGDIKVSTDVLNAGTTYYIRHKAQTTPNAIPASAPLEFTCASAAVSTVTVSGSTTGPVSGTATITLNGVTFKDVAANTEWDTNIAGVKAKVTAEIAAGATTANVTFSGTPATPSNGSLTVTIPAEALSSDAQLTTTMNANTKWDVTSNTQTRQLAANFTDQRNFKYKDLYGHSNKPGNPSANITDSGEGWKWYVSGTVTVDGVTYTPTAQAPVLVLSGVNFDTTAAVAMTLPANTTVVLKSGTTNTIKGGVSTSSDHARGIFSFGALTITGVGSLTATGGTATGTKDSNGICAGSTITVTGATVRGVASATENGTSAGIVAANQKLIINSGSVSGTGGNSTGSVSYGVFPRGGMELKGGSLTATAGTAAPTEISVGVYSGGTIDVTAGTLNASGSKAAIASESNITFASTMAITAPSGGTVGDGEASFGYPCRAVFSGSALATSVTIGTKPTPPSGGSSPGVTVPASSDEGSVKVSATVSNGAASISATDAQLAQIASGSETSTGTVTVDVTALKVDEAVIPAKLVTAAAGATGSEGLEVEFSAGSVTLDVTALESIGNNSITVSVENVNTTELTEAQKETLGDKADTALVVDINVLVNGIKTANFNGGVISVGVPYAPKTGEDISKLAVWYLADDGSIEPMNGKYTTETKCYEFTTTHLSTYVLTSFPFTDVATDTYYYSAVAWAVAGGITEGTSAETFGPDAICTRAQMVTFLWRALGSPEPTITACQFTDVDSNAYYYKAILWAAEKSITEGTSATTFRPNDTVTRAQVVTLQWRTAGKPAATTESPFKDVAAGAYYADAVLWAVEKKITEGTSATTFSPADPCTRAQIVTFLYRYLGK